MPDPDGYDPVFDEQQAIDGGDLHLDDDLARGATADSPM